MDMPIDHITTNGTMETYKMRYILDDSNVDPKGIQYPPILFYCGNEGDIWTFYNNTGFMTQTLGPMFKALVLFAEHRFYGESLPFGDQTFTPEHVRFLTVD